MWLKNFAQSGNRRMRAYGREHILLTLIHLDLQVVTGEQPSKHLAHFRLVIKHCDNLFSCWHCSRSLEEIRKAAQPDLG
jgi:hypothetical protein